MTATPLITLTTDFGISSPYVAQMKGVLLAQVPDVRLVDVTHAVPAQQVVAAALILQDSLPWFPKEAIHVAVIDPGVGTSRPVIAARSRHGYLIGPDNGLFSLFELREVVRLDRPEFWGKQVSATFHGRDLMAPVAAALARGVRLDRLGTPVDDWQRLDLPRPQREDGKLIGEILFADSFGNLITNLTANDVPVPPHQVSLTDHRFRWVGTYGEAEPGEPVALIGSSGRLELAVVNGDAARTLPSTGRVVVQEAAAGCEAAGDGVK